MIKKDDFMNGLTCAVAILIAIKRQDSAAELLNEAGYGLEQILNSTIAKVDYVTIMHNLTWRTDLQKWDSIKPKFIDD